MTDEITEFDELYQRHRQMVRRVLSRLVPPHSVDDGVQEVFLKAFRFLHQCQDKEHSGGWLYRIAVHWAQDYHRRQPWKRWFFVPLAPDEEPPHDGPGPDQSLAQTQTIQRALARLSFKERSVIVLFYWEEQSLEDIADHLQIPLGTVKSRLNQAREKLRVDLHKEFDI